MPRGIGLAPRKPGGQARAESLHFFSTEPLFLIPFGSLPAVQEVTSGASESFRRNQFSSCPAGSDWHRGSQEVRPARSSRRQILFDGTTFPHSPGSNQRLPEAKGSGLPESKPTLLFAEPFPHSLQFTGDPWPHPRFLRSAFVSSSLHGESGIPAVPKTGASAPRLLPPTS